MTDIRNLHRQKVETFSKAIVVGAIITKSFGAEAAKFLVVDAVPSIGKIFNVETLVRQDGSAP